jgi:excisionase family DNA binding protein
MTTNSLLKIEDVAKRLGVGVRSVYKLIDVTSEDPKLPSVKMGRRRLIKESDIRYNL